jgi:hypothetical protein
MNTITIARICLFVAFFICLISCHESQEDLNIPSTYKYLRPQYSNVGLQLNTDTLHFVLNDNALNDPGTVNLFVDNGIEYLTIQEEKSLFINVYELYTQKLIKKIFLKESLTNLKPSLTSVYVKNFDSIFVSDRNKALYLLDSSGKIKYTASFPEQENPELSAFANFRPIIIKDSALFTGICPSYVVNYKNGLNKWRPLYKFSSFKNKAEVLYLFPPRYHTSLFDYHFFNYSYCVNDKDNFVFSFPADSNVYETNLSDLHLSYYGKSQFQKEDILPELAEDLKNGGGTIQYRIRDAYGPVYFDPYHKRYLRLFMQKMSKDMVMANKHDRKQSILILNDSLRIIGESLIPSDIKFSGFVLTKNGNMYVRVNPKDKRALHFLQIKYKEEEQVAQNVK